MTLGDVGADCLIAVVVGDSLDDFTVVVDATIR